VSEITCNQESFQTLLIDTSVKARGLRTLEEMPTAVTFEAVMERTFSLQKVRRGRQQIEAGEGIPNEEAKQGIERSHEKSGQLRRLPSLRRSAIRRERRPCVRDPCSDVQENRALGGKLPHCLKV
jgi:hypothetical protein